MVDTSDVDDLDPFALLDAESERVASFLSSLGDQEWTKDTRCEGWRRREILSHLDGVEVYHTACLNDDIQALFAKAAEAGMKDMNSFNDWIVRERADLPVEQVLSSWRSANSDVRRRMRELGRDGSMSSSVGPYPVSLMAVHIASEYATHYDDMDGPLTDAERDARTAWREKVSRFGLKEAEKKVELEESGDGYVARAGGKEARLSRSDFVEAVTARLKTIDPELQDALRALA